MAKASAGELLRPTVLDRLLQPANQQSSAYGVGFRELRKAVERDLEWLLNTTSWLPMDLSSFPESQESVLTYGIPEL